MKGLGVVSGVLLLCLAGALVGGATAEAVPEEDVVEDLSAGGDALPVQPRALLTRLPGDVPPPVPAAREVLRALGPRPPPAV